MTHRLAQTPRLSCVMPAYNEAGNLARVVTQLAEQLPEWTSQFEIIVVDDGSRDNTVAIARELCATLPQLVLVVLSRNFGKEAALSAGLDMAKGDVVILMDSDGQHPSSLIGTMLEHWRKGLDVVYAVRKTRDDQSRLHARLTGFFYSMVNWGSRVRIPAHAGDFRLLDRSVVKALKTLPERNRFMKGLYAWVGFQTLAIEYEPLARLEGQSQYGLVSSFRLALTGLLAFSTLPLKLLTVLGVALSLGALGYGLWVIADYLLNGVDVPGYATLIVSQMFFNGVQLLAIGTLAAYVARIYEEVKQRPLYLLKEHIGKGLDQP
jgi:glycosyltransferase involved in cell wall biosynthesis